MVDQVDRLDPHAQDLLDSLPVWLAPMDEFLGLHVPSARRGGGLRHVMLLCLTDAHP
jgi:hypothetical protein